MAAFAFVSVAVFAAATSIFVFLDEQSVAVHRAKAFDYSWYLQRTQPRLTGAVKFVRPEDDLLALAATVSPGTTLVLLPGRHALGSRQSALTSAALENMWLIGCGPDLTTLSAYTDHAVSLRLEGMTIECDNNPFCDLREGGSLHLRNCRVGGYNSGAGGSDAIFGVGAVLLIEGCEFDGRNGNASASIMRGNAFDLRGENHIFIRNTRFINNQEIFRTAEGVMDGCSHTSDQPDYVFPPDGKALHVRNSPFVGPRVATGSRNPITESIDDFGILEQLARGVSSGRTFTDPLTREVARTLDVGNDAFWRRLLIHPDARVRALAQSAAHLPPAPAPATPSMTLEQALAKLDEAIMPPDVVFAILADNELARPPLEALSRTGTPREQGNAAALLN